MRRSLPFVLLVSSACNNLIIPPEPPRNAGPVIAGFVPPAAFSDEALIVYGENFDPLGNQLLFAGGYVALALTDPLDDGGAKDRLIDGGLVFQVPVGLQLEEPIVVANTNGRSAPSASSFTPLGTGHPNVGTQVGAIRFRHNPVGLIDREENVLLGSSLFDLVLTDGKAFQRVPGRPIALKPSSRPDRALVSVRTAQGGRLLEVSDSDGSVIVASEDADTREQFILPPAGPGSIARTIGTDEQGRVHLSTWTEVNGALVATSIDLPLTEVFGASANGPLLMIVARGTTTNQANVGLYSHLNGQTSLRWSPQTNALCLNDPESGRCQPPTGPVAIVPAAVGEPQVAIALSSGDLLLFDTTNFIARTITLISYAPVDDLVPGVQPNKVLLTKSRDGALFQYDIDPAIDELDWSVQIRGEPTVIATAPGIDEVAVGNRADNSVDTITASTGVWTGRIAFDLGLGAAPGHTGGVVPGYSYHPDRYATKDERLTRPETIDVLMRNIGIVLSVDASSLEILGHTVLDSLASESLKLLVTREFQTVVMHRRRIGVLEQDSTHPTIRVERLVTPFDVDPPLDALLLPNGRVVVRTVGSVRAWRWNSTNLATRMLETTGELVMPAGRTLVAIASIDNDVVVLTSGEHYAAARYSLDMIRTGGMPKETYVVPEDLSDFVGLSQLHDGPAFFFARSTLGPAAFTTDNEVATTLIGTRNVAGASPDGRYAVWVDQSAPEPTVRLMSGDDYSQYATYRLPAAPSGAEFEPSGAWLFLPLTRLDELHIVQ